MTEVEQILADFKHNVDEIISIVSDKKFIKQFNRNKQTEVKSNE
jgi:hypothetical protein